MRAKLQANVDPGHDWGENKGKVVLADRVTIRELEQDECKRKVQRCLFVNRLSFSELFDDISLMLNVRRLCVVVDSLISAAKVCDCVISTWC